MRRTTTRRRKSTGNGARKRVPRAAAQVPGAVPAHSERAWHESEAGLRVLVSHIPAMVVTTDAELRITTAVGASLQDIGLQPERLVGFCIPDLVAGVDSAMPAIDAHQRALRGETVSFEAAWRGHFYEARLEPLRNGDGRIVGTVGVGLDVTELKEARNERLQNAARTKVLAQVSHSLAEARFDMSSVVRTIGRLISETMGDGCVISLRSPDGRTLYPLAIFDANPDARLLLEQLMMEVPWVADNELVAEPLAGRPLRMWIDEQTALRALIPERYRAYLDRVEVHGVLVVPLRVEGRIIGLLSVWRSRREPAYTIDDEVLMQELADRAALAIANARLYSELEQRVQERTVQLEATNKELETFSYSVSHDLRAPLRGVNGFARALRDDYAQLLPLEGRHFLERVLAGGQRMEQLIDDLLILSRTARAEIHRRPVCLSDLAHEVGEELQRSHPERAVALAVAPDVVADGDARLLRILMENLLGNAWKYTAKHATARVEFGVREQGGESVYFVRDDGAGFDMQYADKLFGPFQRLHSAADFGGSGLGLATVQRIINRHGGRVWADGAVEQGATFSFTVPAR
jgi:PAS domain S-box-containing protein